MFVWIRCLVLNNKIRFRTQIFKFYRFFLYKFFKSLFLEIMLRRNIKKNFNSTKPRKELLGLGLLFKMYEMYDFLPPLPPSLPSRIVIYWLNIHHQLFHSFIILQNSQTTVHFWLWSDKISVKTKQKYKKSDPTEMGNDSIFEVSEKVG